MDKKLAERLKKANKNWKTAKGRAETEKSGFDEIDDGRYLGRLTGAEITESKSSSRLQVSWTWKLLEGDFKGQTKMAFDGLESEDNLMYLAKTLKRFGYESPDDLSDLETLLKELVKESPMGRIRLKTRGEFQNVYIDQIFDKDAEDEALADAASEAADGEEDDAEAEAEDEPEAEEETEEAEVEDEAEAEEETEAEEAEEATDDEVELAPGLKVKTTYEKKEVSGVVLEVLENEDKVRVELDGGKVIRVKIDTVELADDEEDVPAAPAPPAKKTVAAPPVAAKKPAAAPVKKTKK